MPRQKTYNTLLRNGPTAAEIRLPDGRVYNIAELQNKISRRRNHDLRTGRSTDAPAIKNRSYLQVSFRANNIKYDLEDRLWQSENTAEAIQQRYGIATVEQARGIKYKANNIIKHLRATGVL